MNEAYNLGTDAAYDYKDRSENPYEAGTEDYNAWDQGWCDATADKDDEEED